MAAAVRIQDGSPIWLSLAIVPSTDTVVSPGSSPSLATVHVTSTNVFVYVRVDNVGTDPIGVCTCSPVPAPWPQVALFPGFLANPSITQSETQAGVTFTARPASNAAGDTLSGAVNFSFGVNLLGRRAWAWSSDNRFFAYASSLNGNDWYLTIVALQNVTRSNGTVIPAGQAAVSGASGSFSGLWTKDNFRWGLKAVVVSGTYAGGGGLTYAVACPEAPGNNTWGDLIPDLPGQSWVNLSSPCGAVIALVPRILQAGVGSPDIVLISTATAQIIQFKENNVTSPASIVGANPALTTTQHAALGVTINTGAGLTVTRDDPDCTVVGGDLVVRVDRVKASTLPSANLGVVAVGTASLGLLPVGQSRWVQVPNSSGWANQSERHWCLLAQAYTADGTTIARPWNGQAASPPPFPVALQNCAQRNIEILL